MSYFMFKQMIHLLTTAVGNQPISGSRENRSINEIDIAELEMARDLGSLTGETANFVRTGWQVPVAPL